MLQDAAKEVLGLSRRQISENNDDRFVVRDVAVDRLSGKPGVFRPVLETLNTVRFDTIMSLNKNVSTLPSRDFGDLH